METDKNKFWQRRYYDPDGKITGTTLEFFESLILGFDMWASYFSSMPKKTREDYSSGDAALTAFALWLRHTGRLKERIVFNYAKSFAAPSTPLTVVRRPVRPLSPALPSP